MQKIKILNTVVTKFVNIPPYTEFQLAPSPPRHFLSQYNPEWLDILVPAYPQCPENWPLNNCSEVQ